MGWSYGWDSKDELIHHLLDEQSQWTTVARSVVGNHLWAVLEQKPGPETPGLSKRFIFMAILACDRGEWGYKDMEESMGPNETDCPLKYLDMVPDPGGYATEWRAKVRAARVQKRDKSALVKSLRPGMRVKLVDGCNPPAVTVMATVPYLRGQADDGRAFKVQPRHVESVLSYGF